MKTFDAERGVNMPSSEYELAKERVGRLLDEDIRYRLYKKTDGWHIRVDFGDDHAWYAAGADEKEAQRIFGIIVEGEVTPCTLKYIAEDII